MGLGRRGPYPFPIKLWRERSPPRAGPRGALLCSGCCLDTGSWLTQSKALQPTCISTLIREAMRSGCHSHGQDSTRGQLCLGPCSRVLCCNNKILRRGQPDTLRDATRTITQQEQEVAQACGMFTRCPECGCADGGGLRTCKGNAPPESEGPRLPASLQASCALPAAGPGPGARGPAGRVRPGG